MSDNTPQKQVRDYTIYAAVGTLLELGLTAVVFFYILPIFKISLSPPIIILTLLALLAFSSFTYYMGRLALQKKITVLYSMIGKEGIAISDFQRKGYVKVGNELWMAVTKTPVKAGQSVEITGIKGLKIYVCPRESCGAVNFPGDKLV